MCGINGFIQYSSEYTNDQISSIINQMNKKILHRGPDDDGVFANEDVGLGMRRLSIIDLKTGKQPIFNEDKSLVIVLNGEIYNYRFLQKDLMAKGHIFSTSSDTEVVLHCFEEYGTDCFNKLKGMFAVAIYNLVNKKIIIARDRAGEKPLYYYSDSNKFLFASEVKSIMSTGLISKSIDIKALNQYLQLTYIPAPLTIYQNICKLLPGHFMEIGKTGDIKIEQYWDVNYESKSLIWDYDECKNQLRKTLFNAVEECMVSDVPIGTFLSGGIDSTIISGIASKISNRKIDSFTIGYRDKEYDESQRAILTAKLHNMNHHIYYLDYEQVLPHLETMLNNIDEPFADSSYIPSYMISNFASKDVKVVLTGDAGDELFGGYSKYLIGYYSNIYKKIPKWIRDYLIKKVVFSIPDRSSLSRKARKVLDNADLEIFEQRLNLMCLGFKNQELSKLLNPNILEADSLNLVDEYYHQHIGTEDELSHALYTDFKIVLEGDMLTKVDRASMLASLETRTPILNKDIVELAARIPSKYKINTKNTKIILKDTFKDLIPSDLLNASKKGFGVPVSKWFKNELRNELLHLFDEEFIVSQGIFCPSYINQIIEEHLLEKRNRGNELWTLYVFQKWYKGNLSI